MPLKADAIFEKSGDLSSLKGSVEQMLARGAKCLYLLSCENNIVDLDELNSFLKSIPVPVFGGVFPRIIFETNFYSQGTIICGMDIQVQVENICGLNDSNVDYTKKLSTLSNTFKKNHTFMIFVDATNKYISSFIEAVYQSIGGHAVYMGGGAGALSMKSMPCIYSNHGLLRDCGQIIGFDLPGILSVDHGWEKLAGPFVITEAQNNIVRMMNFNPAFEVYQKNVNRHSDIALSRSNFADISRLYPLGIEQLDGSFIVRDPFAVNNNEIICVGDIPENSIVYILNGNTDKLIAAASNSILSLENMLITANIGYYPLFLFDCISRCLILGSKFIQELQEFKKSTIFNKHMVVGAATIGEFASHGVLSLEYLNKTIVVGLLLKE